MIEDWIKARVEYERGLQVLSANIIDFVYLIAFSYLFLLCSVLIFALLYSFKLNQYCP